MEENKQNVSNKTEHNPKNQNEKDKRTTAAEINNIITGATDSSRATAGKEKAIEGTDVNYNKKSV